MAKVAFFDMQPYGEAISGVMEETGRGLASLALYWLSVRFAHVVGLYASTTSQAGSLRSLCLIDDAGVTVSLFILLKLINHANHTQPLTL